MRPLAATIYVDTRLTESELAHRLASSLGAQLSHWTIAAETYEIDVVQNEDRPQGSVRAGDEFLYYPYVLEVEWRESGVPRAEIVAQVSVILRSLEGLHARYVTAADFEDELPGGGRSAPDLTGD